MLADMPKRSLGGRPLFALTFEAWTSSQVFISLPLFRNRYPCPPLRTFPSVPRCARHIGQVHTPWLPKANPRRAPSLSRRAMMLLIPSVGTTTAARPAPSAAATPPSPLLKTGHPTRLSSRCPRPPSLTRTTRRILTTPGMPIGKTIPTPRPKRNSVCTAATHRNRHDQSWAGPCLVDRRGSSGLAGLALCGGSPRAPGRPPRPCPSSPPSTLTLNPRCALLSSRSKASRADHLPRRRAALSSALPDRLGLLRLAPHPGPSLLSNLAPDDRRRPIGADALERRSRRGEQEERRPEQGRLGRWRSGEPPELVQQVQVVLDAHWGALDRQRVSSLSLDLALCSPGSSPT